MCIKTIDNAYQFGHRGLIFNIPDLTQALNSGVNFPVIYSIDEEALIASISAIAAEVDVPSIPPSITVLEKPDSGSGSKIVVEEGEVGKLLNTTLAKKGVKQNIARLKGSTVSLTIETIHPDFEVIDTGLTKMRAERLLDKKLVVSYADDSDKQVSEWELIGEDLVGFLDFNTGFNKEKIASYSATLKESVEREPVNATFVYKNGRVEEFNPAINGLKLPVEETSEVLVKALFELETSSEEISKLQLPIMAIPPEITIEDVNSLGIKELLGRGTSTFHGSIANREYNIALASSRISGVLIAPGETFSFNKMVGDVSGATGYRQSYIIKEGRTILDDGGGVCQVSTTLFRAALDAGLPIVERRAHSYRVYYYEQNSKPGYDATVFFPTVDLKFKNDTPDHILIQTKADTKANSLEIELYGTADGRIATTSNHRLWDVNPPPPDLYQDDPTLPSGTIKQVDWKAWGAKAKFDYKVTQDGVTIFEKTFYSNFKPWQNVFLRGTGQ